MKATVYYLDWNVRHGIQQDIKFGINGFREYSPTKEQFKQIYREVMKVDVSESKSDTRIAEEIFEATNIGALARMHKVRSMCVCDIIKVRRKYYICSSFGFKEIKMQ